MAKLQKQDTRSPGSPYGADKAFAATAQDHWFRQPHRVENGMRHKEPRQVQSIASSCGTVVINSVGFNVFSKPTISTHSSVSFCNELNTS